MHTGGFLDDTNIRAVGDNCIQGLMVAWEASCEFDKAAGMRTNKTKTAAYANEVELEKC